MPTRDDPSSALITKMLRHGILSAKEELRLARRARNGDIAARNALVTANARFVAQIAHGYRGYRTRFDDLLQEGFLGMLRATAKFDPRKKYRFVTYAVWWVRAYIQLAVMREHSMVKIGTTQSQRSLFFKIRSAESEMERGAEGARVTDAVLADRLETLPKHVAEMRARMSGDLSLDAPIGNDPASDAAIDFLKSIDDEEENFLRRDAIARAKRLIATALDKIPPRQCELIRLRLLAEEPLTLQEIGERWGLSRERVRQIEQAALKNMRGLFDPSNGGVPDLF